MSVETDWRYGDCAEKDSPGDRKSFCDGARRGGGGGGRFEKAL